MFVKLYRKPEQVGWLGWIETRSGRGGAVIRRDGELVLWGD